MFREMRLYAKWGFRRWMRKTSAAIHGVSATMLASNLVRGGVLPVGPRIWRLVVGFVGYGANPVLIAAVFAGGSLALIAAQAGWDLWFRDTGALISGGAASFLVVNFFTYGPNPVARRLMHLVAEFFKFGSNPFHLAVVTASAATYVYLGWNDRDNEQPALAAT